MIFFFIKQMYFTGKTTLNENPLSLFSTDTRLTMRFETQVVV